MKYAKSIHLGILFQGTAEPATKPRGPAEERQQHAVAHDPPDSLLHRRPRDPAPARQLLPNALRAQAPRISPPRVLGVQLRAGHASVVVPPRDQDRADLEHRRGRLYRLLATVLHLLPPYCFPTQQRHRHELLDVARMDQLRDQSVYLRVL